jgi:DNA-binding NtrC family response regulator
MSGFDGNETMSAPLQDPLYMRQRHGGPVVALRVKSTGRTVAITDRDWRLAIGSRESCELHLDDPYVSGLHCMLERRGRSLVVRDRGSKNGTFVNGTAVEVGVLRPGSVLKVGRTEIVAVAEGMRDRPTAYEQLLGSDPRFRAAVDQAVRAAATDHSVLLIGETGTGKELFAEAIHEASHRVTGPFVPVNCGGISSELIASELFGHERGAFTGALVEREGFFAEAEGGTLFLDELGELPLDQQPHLLRALETRRIRRVGGAAERPVDVRIVAATNRIEGLGTDRSPIRIDLFHRLSTVVIALPPLRERPSDIRDIVGAWLADLAPQHGAKRIGEAAWAAMYAHDWPGNVRELRCAVLRAVSMGGPEIGPSDLFPELMLARSTPRMGPLRARAAPPPDDLVPYEAAIRDVMREALIAHRTIRRAADALGMPKSTFAERAQRYGLLDGRRRKGDGP